MNIRQRRFLDNFNRILIFALTLMALLMDGYQHADVPAVLALLIWLWLTAATNRRAPRWTDGRPQDPEIREDDSGNAPTADEKGPLLEGLRRNDARAYETLVRLYGDYLYRVAWRLTRSEAEARARFCAEHREHECNRAASRSIH